MTIRKIVLALTAAIFLFISANAFGTIISYQKNGEDIDFSNLESTISEHSMLRPPLQNIQGLLRKAMDKRRIGDIYKLENGHLASIGGSYTGRECSDAVIALNDFCHEEKTDFLYINLPSKMESPLIERYGVKSYTGQNADLFLNNLREGGVDAIDLRGKLVSDTDDPMDIFFRTDHHWKPATALDAVRLLTGYVNNEYGIELDTSRIADGKFTKQHHPSSWTGEHGEKVSVAYAGKDDFDIILPKDPGKFHLRIPKRDIDRIGDFSIMLDERFLKNTKLYYVSAYYTYLFGSDPLQIIDDLTVKKGRILLIRDSFGNAAAPYLAMTCSHLFCRDERFADDDIKQLIRNGDFDLVIVMYTSDTIKSPVNDPASPFLFNGLDLKF